MQKQNTLASAFYILVITLIPTLVGAQILFGDGIPDGSAVLDIQSNGGGVLFPRLNNSQRDGIASPATGLILYNTSTSCLEVNVGTPAVVEWARLNCLPGSIATLDCSGATVTGSLSLNQVASGVSVIVPFTGGNSGVHEGQSVGSTGIGGLTATLAPGNFTEGSGSVSYAITGTPASAGTASFALNIGSKTCTLDVTVSSTPVCRAKVNATDYKNFMCYNLGVANDSADPFTPGWEINGGYWQWGRLTEAAAGPSATDPKDGAVSGWNTTKAANGSWADGFKTSNDPCPAGYRVPTQSQWNGVIANNTLTSVGTFGDSATNYGAGSKFGNQLMLPAAGGRVSNSGLLIYRGFSCVYSSSTESSIGGSMLYLAINGLNAFEGNSDRTNGYSVRCISE